jgi:hypothetical protein
MYWNGPHRSTASNEFCYCGFRALRRSLLWPCDVVSLAKRPAGPLGICGSMPGAGLALCSVGAFTLAVAGTCADMLRVTDPACTPRMVCCDGAVLDCANDACANAAIAIKVDPARVQNFISGLPLFSPWIPGQRPRPHRRREFATMAAQSRVVTSPNGTGL